MTIILYSHTDASDVLIIQWMEARYLQKKQLLLIIYCFQEKEKKETRHLLCCYYGFYMVFTCFLNGYCFRHTIT